MITLRKIYNVHEGFYTYRFVQSIEREWKQKIEPEAFPKFHTDFDVNVMKVIVYIVFDHETPHNEELILELIHKHGCEKVEE